MRVSPAVRRLVENGVYFAALVVAFYAWGWLTTMLRVRLHLEGWLQFVVAFGVTLVWVLAVDAIRSRIDRRLFGAPTAAGDTMGRTAG